MVPEQSKATNRDARDLRWWSREGETGHWVLVVSKEEMRIGFDPWGYAPGQLKAEIQSLLPNPPSVITTEQLGLELYILGGKRPLAFTKALQRYLRQLKAEGLARSVPLGDDEHSRRLGWMKISGACPKADDIDVAQPRRREILRAKCPGQTAEAKSKLTSDHFKLQS